MLKSANFEYLLDKRLRKVHFKTLAEIPSKIPALYNVNNSSLAVEYDYEIGDIGAIGEFNGKIDYQDISGQYRTTYEHDEFAGGIQIQQKLLDDEQYSVINKAPALLAVAMRRRREASAAAPFNHAFDTTMTYGDSLQLCSNSHTAVGSTKTWDNLGSAALSPASIAAARLAVLKLTSDSDQIVDMSPDTILVPVDLVDTADIIIKTTGKVDSANNDINVNKDRFNVISWRYLTDTTNWFMLDSRLMKNYLNWFNRIPVRFDQAADSDTFVKKYTSYMRYSCGASGWRFVYGSEV
jgi:hypothetical protein